MLVYAIIGFVVAVVGFLVIELGGKRFGKNYTFYSMLVVIFLSLMAAAFFPEAEGMIYRATWMLGMLIMVGIGFIRRFAKKNKQSDR